MKTEWECFSLNCWIFQFPPCPPGPLTAPGFLTLPRNPQVRRTQSAACQDDEVRLAPFFDGMGPRTSANGSQEHQPGRILQTLHKLQAGQVFIWKIFSCFTKIVAHFCSNSRNGLVLKYPIYCIVPYSMSFRKMCSSSY